jgi:hypothetical protein
MRVSKIPFLALLSTGSFATLWWVQFASTGSHEPAEDLLLSFVLAALYGWPALFGLARSFGAGAFGRSIAAAAIALSPALVTLALFRCESYFAAVAWPSTAISIWAVAQVVAVPLAWAAARAWFENHGPLPNNSSKPTPLRGAA